MTNTELEQIARSLKNIEGLLTDFTSAYVGAIGGFRQQYTTKREARHRRGAGGSHTRAEWQALKAMYDFTCLKCHRREPEILLTKDHVIPLGALGGTNYIDNLQPMCGDCNQEKADTHIDYRPEALR